MCHIQTFHEMQLLLFSLLHLISTFRKENSHAGTNDVEFLVLAQPIYCQEQQFYPSLVLVGLYKYIYIISRT